MSNTRIQLDNFTKKLNDDAFLANKGLSNEVGIHILCYEPEEEMLIENYLQKLAGMSSLKANIILCDLYEIFLELCEEKRVIDRIPQMEEQKDSETFLTMLSYFATPEAFVKKMDYGQHQPGDVLIISGVGKVYPYMRCNHILENIQPVFPDIPVVVFYPGKYTGQQIKLFNKFSSNYYRAFNLL